MPPTITLCFTVNEFETYRKLKQQVVEQFEREFCRQLASCSCNGTLSSLARLFHMDRKHLGDLMKKHNIKLLPVTKRTKNTKTTVKHSAE